MCFTVYQFKLRKYKYIPFLENNGLSLQEAISAPQTSLQTPQGLARKPSDIHKLPSWALLLHVTAVLSHPPSRTLSGVSFQSLWLSLCPHLLSQLVSSIPSGHQLPCSRDTCLGFCGCLFFFLPHGPFFMLLFLLFFSEWAVLRALYLIPTTSISIYDFHTSSSRLNTTPALQARAVPAHLSPLLGCLTQLRQIV